MKIFIVCSKSFYDRVASIQKTLELNGHTVLPPNNVDHPAREEHYRNLGAQEHSEWKAEMLQLSVSKIEKVDALLVLNFYKNGTENYIGGATFLEMYDAFKLGKKIFLYNPVPEGILHDEILGFEPIVIHSLLQRIS